MTVFHIF